MHMYVEDLYTMKSVTNNQRYCTSIWIARISRPKHHTMQRQPMDIDEQRGTAPGCLSSSKPPSPVFSILFAGQLLQPFRRYPNDTIVEPLIVAVYILSSIFILDKIED